MSTITVKDGTTIYYKDWGTGQPVVFSHGWPLSSDDWDAQMLFFLQHGYRVIALDRRGHGRSTQTWDGNDMDHCADDLAELMEKLDLRDAIHVGHSTGGGDVARYIGRHGTKRVAKAVLIGAVPPVMVKSDKNPDGVPISVFDDIRAAYAQNRSQFYLDLTLPFYGYNRPSAKISEGIREDLKKMDIPTLVMHGDDDQIVPVANAALKSAKILKRATLKVYPGLPHGMCTTNPDQINADLLAFFKGAASAAAAFL